ncbi:MAG: apolipoprotein N-acyltransferase [Actinomycetota bacterium]
MLPREAPEPARRPGQQPLPRLRLIGAVRSRAARWGPATAAGAVSGALTALAFPPADAWPLAFVALAPMAFVFLRPHRHPVGAASAAFGVTFFGLLLSWIRLFGPEAYVALVAAETVLVVAALGAGGAAARRLPPPWGAILFPVAFLAGEYVRSRLLFGGFGWGGLGYTQHDHPALLRLAAYTGVWGLTLVVAATGLLLERALTLVRRSPLRAAACVSAGVLLVVLPGRLPVGAPGGSGARIAVVQGDAPEGTADPSADDRDVLRSHLTLTAPLADRDPSLVVWPESAVDIDPFRDPEVMDALVDSVRAIRAPFLVGATTDEPDGRFRNSSLLVTPDGKVSQRYDKQHLVPFGEYVPFRRILVPLVDELQRVPRDGIPGSEATVLTIPEGRFSVAICFESTFPGIVRQFVDRGAGLLIVSTNDSSFGRTAAAAQHLAFAQVRAAEHRTWVLQAALTGISAAVAPSGEVVARTDLFEPAVLVQDVRFATARTVYARLGDWLPALCLAALVTALVAGAARARRRTPTEAPRAVRV